MNTTSLYGTSQAAAAVTLIGGQVIADLRNDLLKQIIVAVANKVFGIAAGSTITNIINQITNPAVYSVGYLGIPQNNQSVDYTMVLTDSGKHIYHPSADTTARTWTIPANASVAFPIGTAITFVNDTSGGVITVAITSDTMILAGAGTTGSRSLAANGIATAVKITSTRWIISGSGLS